MNDEQEKQLEFQSCYVGCINCGAEWRSSIGSNPFECLNCKSIVDPKLHIILKDEKEVH